MMKFGFFHLNLRIPITIGWKMSVIGVFLDSFGGVNASLPIISGQGEDDFVVAVNEHEALTLAQKKSDNPHLKPI